MREQVFWRKISRIILLLAEHLDISSERAMEIFYNTKVCSMLHDKRYGLYLMSDLYIVHDILAELQNRQ